MMWGKGATVSAFVVAALFLGGCQSEVKHETAKRIKSDPKERFTESEYGVKASPRVTDLVKVPKGGGREQLGRPYKVKGKWYYPKEQPGYVQVGNASWYGSSFHGRLTANGEVYDMFGLSGAHPTFPLPSYARVTNMETGANVVVRINDRGPYVADRMMDLSSKAADMLGYKSTGLGRIKVEYIGKAPLEGDDTPMLMASYRPGNVAPSVNDGLPTGVMLAMNEQSNVPGYATLARMPARTATTAAKPANDAASIDSIIRDAATSETGRRVTLPTRRPDRVPSVVASYAPAIKAASRPGAAAPLGALARPLGAKPQRIEIGAVSDAAKLGLLRDLAARNGGALIADAGEGAMTYAMEIAAAADADTVLRELWRDGVADAFVLRD
ncbi:hypothetical protein GCM10011390_04780 [Aureimonas endophytica]|uniref:Endolytic peptidoglycan transglycosylase RlpA n=1 Tax=Aureimonas endophytica TaxID=2027858 RepID=A0A917E0G4_9HYPH|nr:septal ring lytic transglycosylase RlpA family protein [Aureimonas endophytica]GGD89071.1 hypothetical protein GCM10011390_04780 [Aureimonas endophytica]